jgi:hypothetical protein
MMVKIGVIFMPFSITTCHFRDTANITRPSTVLFSLLFYNVLDLNNQFFSLRGQEQI